MFFNEMNTLLSQIEITDMILSIIFLIAFVFVLIWFFRKIPAVYFLIAFFIVFVAFRLCGFVTASWVFFAVFIIFSIIFFFVNISEIRRLLLKPQKKNKKISNKYDKNQLYRIIDDTVHSLSRSKTGAIMTFERSTNLDDIMKNGTIINAPVSQELLETIFYEGTRLHDGAVIIRGNIIVAASVYYTPTTRALSGKYGSRHRAAFGISEISDAVTVVVSEETGRVSIAYNGSLEPIPLDSFLREFTDLMSIEKTDK